MLNVLLSDYDKQSVQWNILLVTWALLPSWLGQSLPAIALVTRSSFWMGSFSELYLMVNSVDWCLANGCFICLQQPVDKNHSTVIQSVKDGFICVWVEQLSLKLYVSEKAKYMYIRDMSWRLKIFCADLGNNKGKKIHSDQSDMVKSCFIHPNVCIQSF